MKNLISITLFFICSNTFPQSWQTCIDSSSFYKKRAYLSKALEWAEKSYKKQNSEQELFISLNLLQELHDYAGNSKSGIHYTLEKISLCKRTKDKKLKKEYIPSLLNLAGYYFFIKEISKADSVLTITIPLAKGVDKEEALDLQTEILMSKNQWDKLENRPIYDKTLLFRRNYILADIDDDIKEMEKQLNLSDKTAQTYYAAYLYWYPAICYISSLGLEGLDEMYEKYCIDSLYKTAEPVFRNYFGTTSQEYFNFLIEMADRFETEDKPEIAEEIFQKVYRESLNTWGPFNAFSIDAQKRLATIYSNSGNLAKAQQIFEEITPLAEKTYGPQSVVYALYLISYLEFDISIGRDDEAEKKLEIIFSLIEKERGKSSKEYAIAVFYSSELSRTRQDFIKASSLVKEAITINEKNGIDCNPCFINLLVALANNYILAKEWQKAEAALMQASDFLSTHSEELPDKEYELSMQRSLADFYLTCLALNVTSELNHYPNDTIQKDGKTYILSRQKPAFSSYNILKTYEDNTEYYSNKYGNEHPLVANYKTKKALYYWIYYGIRQKSVDHIAGKEFREAMAIAEKYIRNYFPHLSEKEKNELYRNLQDNFNAYYAFGLSQSSYGFYATDEELENFKNKRGSDTVNYEYEKIKPVKFTVSGNDKTYTYIIRENNISHILNHRLTSKGIIFRSSQNIKRRILSGKDSSLIQEYHNWEKIKYRIADLYTSESKDIGLRSQKIDSLQSIANMIERKLSEKSEAFRDKQEEIPITWRDIQKKLNYNEAAIEIIRYYLPQYGMDSIRYAALIVTTLTKNNPLVITLKNGNDMETRHYSFYKNSIQYKIPDNNSYHIYWREIANALIGYNKLYISPDGVYNLINLSSLQLPNGKYLLEEKEIQIVNDLKDIVLNKPFIQTSKNAVLMGDPDFNKKESNIDSSGRTQERSIVMSTILRGEVQPLPGTRKETEQISSLLVKNGYKTSLFQGSLASENNLKTLSNISLLHIATHGFFLNEKNGSQKENPLLRSGLLLSGVSRISSGNQVEDGILTAYEAMNLDLESTELVVLSACETGLGEVQNGEGVYGLQRAFRAAGARNLIMSLWKVNDEATNELMTAFYSEWISTGNKVTAFRNAQLKIKNKYKDPYYWAAFVLISAE